MLISEWIIFFGSRIYIVTVKNTTDRLLSIIHNNFTPQEIENDKFTNDTLIIYIFV